MDDVRPVNQRPKMSAEERKAANRARREKRKGV